MKKNFKIYGIIAIILSITIAVSGVPVVDKLIEKGWNMASLTVLYAIIVEGVITPFYLISWNYFTFSNIDEFSSKWNPTVAGPNANPAIVSVVNSFLRILEPLYIIAIILTGVYLLFIAGTPAGRARAKSMFWKLIFSMVVVTLSMQLFQIFLNISSALTVGVANIGGVDSTTISHIIMPFMLFLLGLATLAIAVGSIPVLTFIIITVLFVLLIPIIVNLRYIILLILAMLFPFTIFLHFLDFQFTKAFGAKLIRLTFIWAFLPVIMMLAVIGSNIAVESYADKCPDLLEYVSFIPGIGVLLSLIYSLFDASCIGMIGMSFVGTIIIFATPFMMSGVMTWIGAGLAMIGMANFDKSWGTGLTTFGGILAGMGPGALMMGGTQAMFKGMVPPRVTDQQQASQQKKP